MRQAKLSPGTDSSIFVRAADLTKMGGPGPIESLACLNHNDLSLTRLVTQEIYLCTPQTVRLALGRQKLHCWAFEMDQAVRGCGFSCYCDIADVVFSASTGLFVFEHVMVCGYFTLF